MADSYEFDFHAVGDGGKSGDAISAKISIENTPTIFVIDGGTTKSGEEVSDRIESYYGSGTIDHMLLTHADDDHSSGLREILDRRDVLALWINRPWLYADELTDSFKGNWTVDGLAQRLRECFPILNELEEKAIVAGIPIYDPLEGARVGPFTVVSPSREFYLSLLPQMTRTPDPVEEVKMAGMLEKGFRAAKSVAQVIFGAFETWNIETLGDDGETSASNESSVVLHGTVDDQHVMLTGDAGHIALGRAADYCEANGLALQNFGLIQMPHHGGRRNVGPTILDRLIGPKVPEDQKDTKGSAIVSASKGDEHHPKRVVMNAFKRRGKFTATTEGKGVQSRHNVDMRDGFSPIADTPIYSSVEE